MGLFDFFRKKEDRQVIGEMVEFSRQAISGASAEIEQHGTFLPFGAVLTKEKALQLVMYHDPEKETIDPRDHAMIIQQILAKKYEDPNTELCHMAFDGVSHLKSGDIDSINVRVSHRPTNTHKIVSFTYRVEDGKVQITNLEDPIISNL